MDMKDLPVEAQLLIEQWIMHAPDALKKEFIKSARYNLYKEDPIGFGNNILKESYYDDIYILLESVRDFPITVAMSATGVGKTFAGGTLAWWWLLCFEDAQVWLTAAPPEDNLRSLLWGEINQKIIKTPEISKGFAINDLYIGKISDIPAKGTTKVVKERIFMKGVPIPISGTEAVREGKFSGKHAPNILFIVDEGDAVPDVIYTGIDGCMSGGHARLVIFFNPRARHGRVYQMIRDGFANVVQLTAFKHPNVITGEDIFPGAVTRDKTIQRINQWTTPLAPDEKPDMSCFEVPDFLVGQTTLDEKKRPYPPLRAGYRRITVNDFAYKVLAQYPPQGENQLYSEEWIANARSRWDSYVAQYGERPPEGIRPVLGLDVADLGPDKNSLAKRYGGWIPRLIKWKGLETTDTADKAADIAKDCKAERINVDSIGIGAGVPAGIRRKGVYACRIDVREAPTALPSERMIEFGTLRDQLYWKFAEFLEKDPGAMIPPDNKLLEQMRIVDYTEDSGKIRVMSKDRMRDLLGGESPDELESILFTFAPKPRIPRFRIV